MLFVLLGVIFVTLVLSATIAVVPEYERLVVFRLGRILGVRGPGVVILLRGLDRIKRVSLREAALDTPAQDLLTRDNARVQVRTLIYARVTDPVAAVVSVENYRAAVTGLAQTGLRAVVGEVTLEQLLHRHDDVTHPLKQFIDQRTQSWGVEVGLVEIKDVVVPAEVSVPRRPSDVGSGFGVEEPT